MSDTQLSGIVDALTTSVLVLESNSSIVAMNSAAETLLGASRQRALGVSLAEFFPHEAAAIRTMLERAAETRTSYAQEIELTPSPVHAEVRFVDFRVSPLTIASGEKLLVEVADMTRRVRVHREQALVLQHGVGRKMVRQLAHEIKNPLGGLRGAAQLLERQLEQPQLSAYTDVIIAEADRLAALVDTLLGPGAQTHRSPEDIHSILEHVARLLESEAGDGLSIRREYDLGLPPLPLDRDQIVQAILNVATNAMTAIDSQGELVFRTGAIDNFTLGDVHYRVIANVQIEDHGPGIPDELRDTVFFPLVTGRDGGTGLGLPLAQEMLARHGGLIEFDSRPGRTVFSLKLPLGPGDNG